MEEYCVQKDDNGSYDTPASVPYKGSVLVESFVQWRPGDRYDEVEEPVDSGHYTHACMHLSTGRSRPPQAVGRKTYLCRDYTEAYSRQRTPVDDVSPV